jgi:hypothetical protein
MYPAPGFRGSIVKPVIAPVASTVAVTIAGVNVVTYASLMVTVGVALYPVPPSTTVTDAMGPLGSGLNAQLP